MHETLTEAKRDGRIPPWLLERMEPLWQMGRQYAATAPASNLGSSDTARTLLSTFFNVAQAWQLAPDEQQVLLGVDQATCNRWREEKVDQGLSPDTLERMGHILNIYAALRTLFPSQQRAVAWLRHPSAAPLLDGQSALSRMLGGRVIDLKAVSEHLGAARAGDFS